VLEVCVQRSYRDPPLYEANSVAMRLLRDGERVLEYPVRETGDQLGDAGE
jgi:hypothetical protein